MGGFITYIKSEKINWVCLQLNLPSRKFLFKCMGQENEMKYVISVREQKGVRNIA